MTSNPLHQTTIPMPAPLCRLCLGDDPKLRKYKDGTADLICDRCWQPETTLPQLHGWQFQPDQDAPGLYLQCATLAQRETIMRALGWYPGCPEYRSDTPNGLQSA